MIPTRRDFLATAAATTVAGAISASPANRKPARRCIVLHLVGGPSQLDTFDPKPLAPSDVRGPFNAIPTALPGVHVSELFPRLAGMMNDVAMIRTLHHDESPIHENGFQLLHTGRRYGDGPAWPGIGSVVSQVRNLPLDPEMPHHHAWLLPGGRVDCGIAVDLGQGAGWLKTRRPYTPDFGDKPQSFHERALMSAYMTGLGERTPAVMTVNQFESVFDEVTWDCHADGGRLNATLADYRETIAPAFDLAFEHTIETLKSMGALDDVLVVAVGEFGRTPKLNANGGRDHWPGCWTALLAGGGVKGGRVIGESNATASTPKDRPVTCPELLATIYHAMGIPNTTTIPGPNGKPVRVVEASPVFELF